METTINNNPFLVEGESQNQTIIHTKEKELSSNNEESNLQPIINLESELFKKKLIKRNQFAYLIISITLGISGISDLAVQYFFKDTLKVQPSELSMYLSIAQIPWFLKPLFGLITDMLPIFGYRRKCYIIICGFLDFLSFFSMFYLDLSLTLFVLLLFFHYCCVSFSSVLAEAVVVELSKINLESKNQSDSLSNEDFNKKSSNAKNNVSYFFFFKYMGTLISSIFKGILVEKFSTKTVFFISSFIPLCFILSGIILMEERIIKKSKDNTDIKESICLLNVKSNKRNSCPAKFFRFLCQKHICVPIIFIIIFNAKPSYSGPMFYFFTDTLNFNSIDLGIVSTCGTLATLIAIATYRYCLKNKSFRIIIIFGSFLSFFVSFSSYLLVTRINIKIGIPDFLFLIFSSSFIDMLGEIIGMPLNSIGAILSPESLEATSYSIFTSAMNFGSIISSMLGSILTSLLDITSKNYSNLPELVIICNVLSLAPLLFLICSKKSYFDPQVDKNENLKVISHEEKSKKNDFLDGTVGENLQSRI
jgi:Na+/melibiose symporter-like transporter